MFNRKEMIMSWYDHIWKFWTVVTKFNVEGLANDIGSVLPIMLSTESRTLAGTQSGSSMERNLAVSTLISCILTF
jgi:hypothetical protein